MHRRRWRLLIEMLQTSRLTSSGRAFDEALDPPPYPPHSLAHSADGAFCRHEDPPSDYFVGPALENCAVLLAGPMCWRFLRVVVAGERFAYAVRGAIHGGYAMEAYFVSFKNDAPVEQRLKAVVAVFDLLVPELEMAAPLGFPAGIEKNQNVEPPVQFAFSNVVEVDVHIQASARTGLMDTAADQFLVRQ